MRQLRWTQETGRGCGNTPLTLYTHYNTTTFLVILWIQNTQKAKGHAPHTVPQRTAGGWWLVAGSGCEVVGE